ncbi:hypothetical protein ABPG77_010393 [Micractinium sp. CCAP 211/92]
MVSKAVHGVAAVLLLLGSNSFMNVAWYLHLKFKSWPLVKAIFLSWLIAFFEYCLQVPANRIGHFTGGGPFTAPQLKTVQEFLSISTFTIFSVTVLKEKLRWSDGLAFGLIFSGVIVSLVLKPKDSSAEVALPPPPVAPAPEPVPPESGADSVAAPSTAAGPKPEAAGKPPSQEGGRKLLELLPRLGRRHDVGHSPGRTTPESQAGPAAQAEEHGHGQDEEWQEEEGSVDEEEQRTERERHGGAGSSQRELMLSTRQTPLQSEGSSTVLVASGAQLHVTSSRQGTQHREHAADDGAGAEGAKESHV